MTDDELLRLYKRKAEIAERQVASVQALLDNARQWENEQRKVFSIRDVQQALTGSGS